MDQLDEIEQQTLEALASTSDLDLQLKRLEILHAIQERRAATLSVQKATLDLENARLDGRFPKTRFWATSLTPLLAILITAVTFVVTVETQNKQFKETAQAQREANESSQWRDAIKSLSVKDSAGALVGAFAMQGYLGSKTYDQQARMIARALLPRLTDVAAFDEILADMAVRTTNRTQEDDLINIAQTISFAQRERFHISGPDVASSGELFPFLNYNVLSIDTTSIPDSRDIAVRTKIAAWELDTVSHRLADLWKDHHNLWPIGSSLDALVLEDATFDDVSFESSKLRAAVLYDASFNNASFQNADLSNALLEHIHLENANLSGITNFEGSVWIDTEWWKARCIAPKLLDYLLKHEFHPLTTQERQAKECQGH